MVLLKISRPAETCTETRRRHVPTRKTGGPSGRLGVWWRAEGPWGGGAAWCWRGRSCGVGEVIVILLSVVCAFCLAI